MKWSFDYFYTLQPNDSVEVEDVSNMCFSCTNDADEWYIKIDTELGITRIIKFGPIPVGSDDIIKEFKVEYCDFDYSENKIIRDIDKFINNSKRMITQIKVVDKDEFDERLIGIIHATGY